MRPSLKTNLRLLGAISLLLIAAGPPASSQTSQPAEPASATATAEDEAAPLSEDELEVLVAPIALYPDDLVATIITASLYPVQIVQAARFLDEKKKKPDLKPSDKWDGSVMSLLNYPEVVKMMSDDLDWTDQLGEVAVNQQKELLLAIQQLRDNAVSKDLIQTTDKVIVEAVNDNIIIRSADPEVVYVPQYEPQMLYEPSYVAPAQPIYYSDPYPSYYSPSAYYAPWGGFWAGAATGALFAAAVDWNDWGVSGGDIDIDNNFNINNIKNGNFNKNQLKQNFKNNKNTNLKNKVKDRPGATKGRKTQSRDVRKNVQQGLKNPDRARPQRAEGARGQGARAEGPRAGADRGRAGKPTASQVKNRKPGKSKPGARADTGPRKPSAMGSPRGGGGKATRNHSNRGSVSRGGGNRGGAGMSRGGGGFRGGGGGGGRGGGGGGRGRR